MGQAYGPFCLIYTFREVCVVQNKMGGAFMIQQFQSPQEQLNELRQLEVAAKVRFDKAKNELIRIRKKIKEINNLITPSNN